MSVSDQEIQRELNNLRSFRRLSASSQGPGAIPLDPDLPPASPPSPSSTGGGQYARHDQHYQQQPVSPTRSSGSQASVFNRTRSGSIEKLNASMQNTSLYNANPSMHDMDQDRVISAGGGGGGGDPGAEQDPSSTLFWLPARLHPELAPGEFRAFLKTHSHTDSDGVVDGVGEATGAIASSSSSTGVNTGGSGPGLARSPSWMARSGQGMSGNLGRKRSMLSRQYQPRANDGVESEPPPLPSEASQLRRSGSSRANIYGGVKGDQGVTLEELQKLEHLVDGAGIGDDPAHMRDLLKRSLSLNVSPELLEGHPDAQQRADDEDAPIIQMKPGQIVRRAARTRIRKPGQLVEPGGSRFGGPRQGRPASGILNDPSGHANESNEHAHNAYDDEERRRGGPPSDEDDDMYSAESGGHGMDENMGALDYRRPSNGSTEESAIYDSYVDSSNDTSVESSTTSLSMDGSSEYGGPSHGEYADVERESQWEEPERTPTESMYRDPGRAAILGDTTQRHGNPPSPPETVRADSYKRDNAYEQLYKNPPPQVPAAPIPTQKVEPVRIEAAPPARRIERQQSTESLKKAKEDEKKKRGGFFSSKKDKDSKPKKEGKKEKEGFLGTLFGSKKKVEEPAPLKFSAAGPAAAAALLGTSKSAKSLGLIPMTGHSPTSPGFSPYARYPIHVERAIYRLSHIKLANPRRPLYEQVLISNLMFWYLGIINKPQTPTSPVADEKAKRSDTSDTKEQVADNTPPASPTSEKSPAVKSSPRTGSPTPSTHRNSSPVAAPAPVPEPVPAKRTGLRKPETQSRTRTAETPVRTPQYGVQNMQMQQEYGRSASSPVQQQAPRPPTVQAPVSPSASSQRNGPPAGLQPSARLSDDGHRGQIPRSARSPDLPHAPQTAQTHSPKSMPSRREEHQPNLRVDVDLSRGMSPQRYESQRSPEGPYPSPHQRADAGYRERERKPAEADRPRSPHSSHSGIQPGQIFHHPSVQLGQPFVAQRTSPGQPVGQIFSHPSYQSPSNHSPHGPSSGYYPERQQHAELPPGAMPPRSAQHAQQWRAAPPPQPPMQQQRSASQYDYEQAKRSASAGYAPAAQPRETSPGPRSFSAGDPRAHPQAQYHGPPSPGRAPPGTRHDEPPYNPYLRSAPPPNVGYPSDRR